MSHTAFFYGTLMAPQVLHRVIWGSPSPPTPAHAALLTLVQGLTDGDIWRLDIFEGSEYARRRVRVCVLEEGNTHGQGNEVDAETYIWTAGESRLEDDEWDFAEFVKDKMARWVGRDADADEGLKGINATMATHS
jgi:hypothetical protein